MRSWILFVSVALLSGACVSTRPQKVDCTRFVEMLSKAPPPPLDEVVLSCPVPSDPAYPFENLVFQGGGVKGIAYVGALGVLEQQGILERIERVAGTSAGAITATLLAVRLTPTELRNLMGNLQFENFKDDGSDLRVLRRYGYYKGDYFLDLMRCLINHQTRKDSPTKPEPTVTFEELARRELARGGKARELRLFATDLTTGEIQELSLEKTPDLEIALAARMSMSIPLFFAAIERDGNVFVDGGVLDNYPIIAFDGDEHHDADGERRKKTLGFTLLSPTQGDPVKIRNLLEYSESLVETVLNVQVDDLLVDARNLARTVGINDLDVPTTAFDLSPMTKQALIDSGIECTCSFLKHWRRNQSRIPQLLATPIVAPKPESVCGWLHPQ